MTSFPRMDPTERATQIAGGYGELSAQTFIELLQETVRADVPPEKQVLIFDAGPSSIAKELGVSPHPGFKLVAPENTGEFQTQIEKHFTGCEQKRIIVLTDDAPNTPNGNYLRGVLSNASLEIVYFVNRNDVMNILRIAPAWFGDPVRESVGQQQNTGPRNGLAAAVKAGLARFTA